MIKIATAQIDVIPGNIRDNWKQIEKEIQRAREKGAHMLVLPEMCLTGYLIGDLWDQNAFLRECEAYNEKIAAASRDITILWGSCAIDWKKTNDDGRPRKYNAAFAAAVRQIGNCAFAGHPESQSFYFVHINALMITDAAFGRAHNCAVLAAIAGKYFGSAVIHFYRNGNFQSSFRAGNNCRRIRVKLHNLNSFVQRNLRHFK